MPQKQQNSSSRSGFALVVALSMMAFVVLLVVSMSFLLSVESSASSTQLSQLKSRESAKLALYVALGELQKQAGPDSRVTARADITGAAVQNGERYWTGVWDTNHPNRPPVWLVSGTTPDPATPSADSLELLGPASVDLPGANYSSQYVSVPFTEVMAKNQVVSAEIAWWVSDEGVKASVGTLPLDSRPNPNFLDGPETEAAALHVANLHGLEELFPSYDRFDPNDFADQDRIQSLDDLNILDGFKDEDGKLDYGGSDSPVLALAPASFGVLANTLPRNNADAGLMRDLSLYPRLLGEGIEDYLLLGESNEAELSGSGVDGLRLFTDIKGIEDIGPLSTGDIAMPVTPVLSNFMVGFTIRQNARSNPNLYLRMVFFCELWNPYTHTIQMVNSDGDPLDLQLEITGFPSVLTTEKTVYPILSSTDENDNTTKVIDTDNPLYSVTADLDLQGVIAAPDHQDSALVIRLKNTDAEDWLPGRTKNWTGIEGTDQTAGPSPYESTVTTVKSWNTNRNKLGNTIGIDTGTDIAIHPESEETHSALIRHFSNNETELKVALYHYDPATEVKTRIATYGDATYTEVNTLPSDATGFSYKHKEITFGYHFVLREPHYSSNDPEYFRGRWLFDDDPRNPEPEFSTAWQFDNEVGATGQGSPYIPVKDGFTPLSTPSPQEINQDKSTINFLSRPRLIDRSSPLNELWQDAPLFELPRQRFLSLAALQHIYFHNERPFQIGNSWGSDGTTNTSAWFDRYYFSGFSRTDDADTFDSDAGPPNPALVTYEFEDSSTLSDWQADGPSDTTAALKPAEQLMVANRFNLNSTSLASWRAVLGSLRLNGWEYLDYPEQDTSDLSSLTVSNTNRGGMFARFSHSLAETYEATDTPSIEGNEPVAPSAFYRHGARRLSGDQLEALATEIVRLIRNKGAPFMDMEEFLSGDGTGSSLLEQAIANVLTEGGRQQWYHDWELDGDETALEGDSIDIDHFSPGFLTQADIMTAIGPMLSTRSDTFKIRARSQNYNPLGGRSGSAALEAIVQRVPETVDTGRLSNNFGRKFKLLSVRWLSEAEL